MRSLMAPRTAMSSAIVARHRSPDDGQARERMGDDVPSVVREDAEFNVLFRESQKIKNSRRPADQKHLANLLNQMRVRWGELTGEPPAPVENHDGN